MRTALSRPVVMGIHGGWRNDEVAATSAAGGVNDEEDACGEIVLQATISATEVTVECDFEAPVSFNRV